MPVVLITGASRGIGAEFCRQFQSRGWAVHACARDITGASSSAHVVWHKLDVTDFGAVDRLADELRNTPVDLLVNNAGVAPRENTDLATLDFDSWRRVMEVNTLAPIRMIRSFSPHVAQSQRKQIVSISSELGSITATRNSGLGRSGAWLPYRVSKAALNMANAVIAEALGEHGITSVLLHPGWVATELGGMNASTKPAESVRAMMDVIEKLAPSDHGKFLAFDGKEIPW